MMAGGNVPGRESRTASRVGVGCVTAVAGLFSGAMFAVLIARVVGTVRGCPSGEHGQPCDWPLYAMVGAVIGMISLPVLALYRLGREPAPTVHSDQG